MRRTLSPRARLCSRSASVIGLALFASVTPSPLYGTYSELWGFSPAVLTLIYATYAFGVLATLVLAGRLSDQVGRRPVLLVALGTLLVDDVLFMLAESVVWLFVARGLQGLATGLALAAASAALLDLHPRRDPASVGLTNGVASAGGIGLGMLVVGDRRRNCCPRRAWCPYVMLFALFAIAFTGALLMPEPVAERSRAAAHAAASERAARGAPAVPARGARRALVVVDRRPVLLARPAAVGEPLRHAATTSSPASASSCSPARRRWRSSCSGAARRGSAPRRGSLALSGGMLIIVASAARTSRRAVLAGARGRRRRVRRRVPRRAARAVRRDPARAPGAGDVGVLHRRLRVAVAARPCWPGIVVTPLGLESTFEIFGSVIAAIALVLAIEATRTRPRQLAMATG